MTSSCFGTLWYLLPSIRLIFRTINISSTITLLGPWRLWLSNLYCLCNEWQLQWQMAKLYLEVASCLISYFKQRGSISNLGIVESSGVSERDLDVKRRDDVATNADVDSRRFGRWRRRRRRRRRRRWRRDRRKVWRHRLEPVARLRCVRISENRDPEIGEIARSGFPGLGWKVEEAVVGSWNAR